MRDSNYLEAVKNNDMETAQRLVDEAAKKAGYAIKGYHGTNRDFTVFEYGHDRKKYSIGKNMGEGFYFATDKKYAEMYSDNKGNGVISSYLKIENPYVLFGTEFDYLDLKNLSKKAGREITKHKINKYLQEQDYDGIINKGYDGKIHAYLVYDSNQIKSVDPVTYDDDGNVIPLSERFKDDNKDIRYSVDDTIIDKYTNIDLSTLDANEIRVYNNRGWSYSLFNNEDLKLLNEKFSELDSKYRTDNVLGDGSRVVEINNKLVLIGGTFKEPMVHGVLTVNSYSETEADYFKERLIYETKINKWDRYQFNDYCLSFESIVGKELVRYYDSADFSYRKG